MEYEPEISERQTVGGQMIYRFLITPEMRETQQWFNVSQKWSPFFNTWAEAHRAAIEAQNRAKKPIK